MSEVHYICRSMAFITKDDLLAYIELEELDEITGGDDTLLTRPLLDAEGYIKARLNHRYDVVAMFAAPTNEDYSIVKQAGVYLALWYLYSKVQARHVPEYRAQCYEEAKYNLHDWATGQWNYNLPKKAETEDGVSNSGQGWTTTKPFLDTRF